MTTPSDWFSYYQNDLQNHLSPFSSSASAADSTTITTTREPPNSPPPQQQQKMISQHSLQLSPESGRVSKPTRRRSRASRRTPTTLLNTDPSNFRAMVQQFTGAPTPTFSNQGTELGNVTAQIAGAALRPGYPISFGQGQQRVDDDALWESNYYNVPDPTAGFSSSFVRGEEG
ncbi:hypothetical protein Droror1_Dr00004719 [Drosera rotundifolia]